MDNKARKQAIKVLFRGYRGMTNAFEKELKNLGFNVVRTKKHIHLYFNGKLYVTSASGSDWRSGANLASIICRDL